MRIRVTSELLQTEYDGQPTTSPNFYADYLHSVGGGYVVPGVYGWAVDSVSVSEKVGDESQVVVILADLETGGTIDSGDWSGQVVNQKWVKDYILGADVYWLAPEVLKATEVVFP